MRFFLKFVTLLGTVAACLIGVGFVLAYQLNAFEDYPSQVPARCTPVVGVPGVEDMAADETLGLAWLSSMDRRAVEEGEEVRGRIVAFDPANPLDTGSWRDRTAGVPSEFSPLGVSLYRDEDVARLFVVNQALSQVLIYDIDDFGDLTLATKPLFSESLTAPNSIIATGPRSFYVSNSRAGSFDGFGSSIDFLRKAATGSIHYYDGNSWSVVATGVRYANGLALSADGDTLYVAETSAKAVATFQRDRETGGLTRLGTTELDTFPDNLTRTGDDRLLITTFPKPLAFSSHVSDGEKLSPSRVLAKTAFGNGLGEGTEILFQSNGEELSGATVAAEIGRKLLIGAFIENKFLLCD
jgi:arylesterase/paraoxonase